MGLVILLETENGSELERVEDPKNLLHKLLPDHDDLSYQLLRFVDWYADTTFNSLQVPVVISELNRIAEEKAQTLEEKALLRDIVRLAGNLSSSGALLCQILWRLIRRLLTPGRWRLFGHYCCEDLGGGHLNTVEWEGISLELWPRQLPRTSGSLIQATHHSIATFSVTHVHQRPRKKELGIIQVKAKCVDCHVYTRSSPFFTDFGFHNTGAGPNFGNFDSFAHTARAVLENPKLTSVIQLSNDMRFSPLGRFIVTRRWRDLAAFKTPSLREVELTGPSCMTGSFGTLLDVVRFYNRGGINNRMLDKEDWTTRFIGTGNERTGGVYASTTSDNVLKLSQSCGPQTRDKVLSYFPVIDDSKTFRSSTFGMLHSPPAQAREVQERSWHLQTWSGLRNALQVVELYSKRKTLVRICLLAVQLR